MSAQSVAAVALSDLISRFGIRRGPLGDPGSTQWSLDTLSGRFAELSSSEQTASLTASVHLILQSQHRGEPAAWVTVGPTSFFPPDLADSGVDLSSLPAIQTDDTRAAARAADHLIRSGAFGLVVLDLGAQCHFRVPVQARLAGLAKKHRTALLCLTKKDRDVPSIGSLVSIRGEAVTQKTSFNEYTWQVEVLKDKRRGPGWRHAGVCRGPDGLC